jgi:hypothetical protein
MVAPRSRASGRLPTPALELGAARDRTSWFDGYVRTYLDRDLQDLAAIRALPDFRRLRRSACLRLGQLVNQTELGRDVSLPQATVHKHRQSRGKVQVLADGELEVTGRVHTHAGRDVELQRRL